MDQTMAGIETEIKIVDCTADKSLTMNIDVSIYTCEFGGKTATK